jgi:hypothetical protein
MISGLGHYIHDVVRQVAMAGRKYQRLAVSSCDIMPMAKSGHTNLTGPIHNTDISRVKVRAGN